MKRFLVVLVVVVMVLALATPAFAHPKGPDSMPEQSLRGLHTGAKEVPDFPQHILGGLMLLTGVDCPHE